MSVSDERLAELINWNERYRAQVVSQGSTPAPAEIDATECLRELQTFRKLHGMAQEWNIRIMAGAHCGFVVLWGGGITQRGEGQTIPEALEQLGIQQAGGTEQ